LLLSHQIGLPVIDTPLTLEDAYAWDPVIRALEAQRPLWQPGTEHVYHSMTFGYLVGEIVRRISGKSLGTFFADEVARPLNLHAWIGLPEAQEPKVARLHYAKPFTLDDVLAGMIETTGLDADTVTAWIKAVWGPDSVQARAGELGGAFDNASGYFTQRAWRAAEVPAANGVADARSVARMYAATVSDVDGVRLLDPPLSRGRSRSRPTKRGCMACPRNSISRLTAPSICRSGSGGPARRCRWWGRGRSASRAPVVRSVSAIPMPRLVSGTSRICGRSGSANRGRRAWLPRSSTASADGRLR
jgi:CubicO group peptidase (beta-lactamase class C family)